MFVLHYSSTDTCHIHIILVITTFSYVIHVIVIYVTLYILKRVLETSIYIELYNKGYIFHFYTCILRVSFKINIEMARVFSVIYCLPYIIYNNG